MALSVHSNWQMLPNQNHSPESAKNSAFVLLYDQRWLKFHRAIWNAQQACVRARTHTQVCSRPHHFGQTSRQCQAVSGNIKQSTMLSSKIFLISLIVWLEICDFFRRIPEIQNQSQQWFAARQSKFALWPLTHCHLCGKESESGSERTRRATDRVSFLSENCSLALCLQSVRWLERKLKDFSQVRGTGLVVGWNWVF